ncbi:hypothetical protein GCM10023084_11070 [Streptomyces lacrimifluminis]|uniref:Membrane-bound hydrophilic protein n=1 Tax=Streptomyces lacrimifluminis TaxID=1500077 RepID=A0A917L835_9ACTN|nr:hypothetical protein [Streptomyces lacrimifluminis]GGJ47237.1 hypothetical protein GCM10012282_50230 [Streptomyces lacrimifluminis]
MPADEVTHGTDVDTSRGKTGPRHAAPRKPLFTRFHVPAGKAIALAAMPTAVLMGMGFTPTLARADEQPTTNSMTAEEYKACVAAMTDEASASASPSVTPSENSSDEDSDEATPTPSASVDDSAPDDAPSSDSGSDDEAEPTPTPSASKTTSSGNTGGDSDTATPTPSASASATEESGGLLETIGDAIVDVFTGGNDSSSDTASTTTTSTETTEAAASATPAPTASPAATAEGADKDTTDTTTVKDTAPKVTEVLKDATDTAAKTSEETTEAATKAADEATASPTPSASETTNVEDCPAESTDDVGGVDNSIRLPDEPWTLQASSLLLKGADYQGIVKVRTADGTVKDVLKYVISGGTDIGDLHQLVKDNLAGKTYHAQAAKGSQSTIDGGKTIMYTESISGNLFGLIPVTFDPKHPPPLNIPLIYFTNVKVIQAGQFGGTLTIPGLHQYTT